MMRDLGSTNGTKVNGQKLREAALPTDTTITIGRTDLVFRIVPVASPSRPAPAATTPPERSEPSVE